MSIMDGISRYPMMQAAPGIQPPQVMFPPALSANPEIAKAAAYGGGGVAQPAQPAQGTQPGAPGAQPGAGASGGQGGIMDAIMKMLKGGGGGSGATLGSAGGMDFSDILSMFA